MAVKDEVAAGVGAIEAADDIRHLGVGRGDAVRQACLFQEARDEAGGLARVTRRIGAPVLDESLQETHEIAAVAVDPIEQLLSPRVHVDIPRPMPIPARRQPASEAFVSGRPTSHARRPHWSEGLFPGPRSPMLAQHAISVILVKLQTWRPGRPDIRKRTWQRGVALRP